MARNYSLSKSRKILRSYHAHFERRKNSLSPLEAEDFEKHLRVLDAALLERDRESASNEAKKVEAFAKIITPKSGLDIAREVIFAILFAVVVAFGIRQFWFELYEVPTGSMRPTIHELDRLLVSKTTFGIHLPFNKKLIFYKPEYIKRAGTIVFTAAGMDMADPDMIYFGLFKGKKRLVKRNVSKPGDTLYFYGGRIYGIDINGNPFTQLSDPSYLNQYGIGKINHIPYISFQGKVLLSNRSSRGMYSSAVFKQMNLPVGRITSSVVGMKGEFFDGSKWITDTPAKLKGVHDKPVSYSDLWGIGNFAQARLLTSDEVKLFYKLPVDKNALLYLELHHTPNMTYPKPEIRQGDSGNYYPQPTPYTSLIPLNQEHLNTLMGAMITSRFCVENGGAHDYRKGRGRPQPFDFDPKISNVKNGCYEFYYGKGYNVHLGGYTTPLDPSNPLYQTTPENVRRLFNQGMRWNLLIEPKAAMQTYNPSRYAFYRDGDLYMMDAPILKKGDPTLQKFVEQEMKKQDASSNKEPYIAFVDHGAPINENGELDVDFIKAFGLKVPNNAIVALGDNYAGSSDSRDFGFVPINNLRGAPSFTFWPPGEHLGPLVQPPYPWVTLPNFLVWGIALIIIIWCSIYYARRNRRSIFK